MDLSYYERLAYAHQQEYCRYADFIRGCSCSKCKCARIAEAMMELLHRLQEAEEEYTEKVRSLEEMFDLTSARLETQFREAANQLMSENQQLSERLAALENRQV